MGNGLQIASGAGNGKYGGAVISNPSQFSAKKLNPRKPLLPSPEGLIRAGLGAQFHVVRVYPPSQEKRGISVCPWEPEPSGKHSEVRDGHGLPSGWGCAGQKG